MELLHPGLQRLFKQLTPFITQRLHRVNHLPTITDDIKYSHIAHALYRYVLWIGYSGHSTLAELQACCHVVHSAGRPLVFYYPILL